jgi:hypothetical protein
MMVLEPLPAAAGDVGDGFSRREPRLEDQRPDLGVGCGVVNRHAALARLLDDAFPVQARTVVGHFNDNASALMEGAQGHGTHRGLAPRKSRLGQLQPMINAVANQMR